MLNELWYRNSIIYSLDVETFMDANHDGIGDFEGLSLSPRLSRQHVRCRQVRNGATFSVTTMSSISDV